MKKSTSQEVLAGFMLPAPLGRLELPSLAPEANALSTELQGQRGDFTTKNKVEQEMPLPPLSGGGRG